MSSSYKPIQIWGKWGPNPPKVRILAIELGLPYEVKDVSFADVKGPEFLKINPNGRMPAIQDPNGDLTLWESGAIMEYLVEKYDKQRKVSFEPGSKEYWHAKQWLFFQVSGQGPYYGQAVWFTKYHPEQVQSAKDRYYKEIKRVSGVLEEHLKKQEKGADGPWMVGGKYSYVDIALFQWQHLMMTMMAEAIDLSEFKTVNDWIERLRQKPAIKEVIAEPMPSS